MSFTPRLFLALSLCIPGTFALAACQQEAIPTATSQADSTQRVQGQVTLPYVAAEAGGGFQTQQAVVVTTTEPTLQVSVNELYRLEATIDGQVTPVQVTDVRVDPLTGQTYIQYEVETLPVSLHEDSVIELRTLDGNYWLGASLITYRPGVLVVDITPITSLDVVLAREGWVPGSMKIGDLTRAELWVLGFDPDNVNRNASIRSIVKANGQVKAHKLK